MKMGERNESSERRRFIRRLIGLGGAGALLGLLQGNANIPKVEAANGDPIRIGTGNVGTADTVLQSGASNTFSGYASSSKGVGVYGYTSSKDGKTRGLVGISDSCDGVGVFGSATNKRYTGTSYGVYGETYFSNGAGVYGSSEVTGFTPGVCYGVRGVVKSEYGMGVCGEATSTRGTTYGVKGQSACTGGAAIYANNTATDGLALKCHGHVKPEDDNMYNCGVDGKRWKLVRAKTVTSGDLVFENGYRFTEDKHSGILLFNQKGERIARFDDQGNLHIKGKIIQDL